MTALSRAVKKLAGARARIGSLGMTVILLIGAVGVGAIVYYSVPRSPSYAAASKPVYFSTLPPGAKLPSGAECARLVQASPSPENRPANKQFNATVGSPVGPGFFPAGDSPQVKTLVPLVNGDFTGTTEDILRWVACKWGIDQDIVFAQAAVESWWDQNELGDWQYDAKNCAPGAGWGPTASPGSVPRASASFRTSTYSRSQPGPPSALQRR